MIIERILHFRGSRSRGDIQTLFDTGATYSCINRTHAQELAVLERLPDPLEMETASEGSFVRVEYAVRLDFYIDGIRLTDEFMVVPNLSEPALIGATTMQKWKIKLDFEHDQVVVDPRVTRMKLI
ncbi:MAG: retropepsin-like aspartic protease [Desulfomonile sp.]|jgi:predicted aspartyl protease